MFDEQDTGDLKAWLIRQLDNLTDADSEILSDYVIALLRHEQPAQEVMQMCLDQLEDFLHENTAGFVNQVFAVLKEYLAVPASSAEPDQPTNGFVPPALSQATGATPDESATQTTSVESQGGVSGSTKGRCKSYDEMGYCMKGDLCPYEHGEERIIISNERSSRPMRGRRPQHVLGPSRDAANTRLFVVKIPPGVTREQVTTEFSQYGRVTQVFMRNGRDSATVSFMTHEEAQAAYTSPASYFNNRFVKVFWAGTEAETAARGRARSASPPAINVEEVVRRQTEKQREYEEREAKRREHEAKLAEIKRKAEEQEALRRELETRISAAGGTSTQSTTEILKAKLAQLKQEADMLGVSVPAPTRGGYRGRGFRGSAYRGGARGSYRGGRGGYMGYGGERPAIEWNRYKLDLRSKRVAIHGLQESKLEDLASYLMSVGEYENIETIDDAKVVTFKDRATAERFVLAGPDAAEVGDVKFSWYNQGRSSEPPSARAAAQEAHVEEYMEDGGESMIDMDDNGDVY